jgi:phospholipid transport system substrate-binding protein
MNDLKGSRFFTRRSFLQASAMAIAAASAGLPVAATAASPQEAYVEDIANDVMKLANGSVRGAALKQRFVTLLNRHSDVRSIALFSLGQYQKDLPGDMKNEFFKLVIEYTAGLFVYYIEDFAAQELEVKSSRPQGKAVIIDSAMRYSNGSRSPVKWRVVKAGGGFRVSDVNVRGIWLSLQMREKFVSLLRQKKGDFAALLDYLRTNA